MMVSFCTEFNSLIIMSVIFSYDCWRHRVARTSIELCVGGFKVEDSRGRDRDRVTWKKCVKDDIKKLGLNERLPRSGLHIAMPLLGNFTRASAETETLNANVDDDDYDDDDDHDSYDDDDGASTTILITLTIMTIMMMIMTMMVMMMGCSIIIMLLALCRRTRGSSQRLASVPDVKARQQSDVTGGAHAQPGLGAEWLSAEAGYEGRGRGPALPRPDEMRRRHKDDRRSR